MISFPSIASAGDFGDGSLACNVGEICFWQHSEASGGTKHFWYSGSHNGYVFSNGVTFKGEASSIRNRDTACSVKVTEEYDFFETVNSLYFSNSGSIFNFNGDLNDDNGRHDRC